jgi:hypothetical protein
MEQALSPRLREGKIIRNFSGGGFGFTVCAAKDGVKICLELKPVTSVYLDGY